MSPAAELRRREYEDAAAAARERYQRDTDFRRYSSGGESWESYQERVRVARVEFSASLRWPQVALLEAEKAALVAEVERLRVEVAALTEEINFERKPDWVKEEKEDAERERRWHEADRPVIPPP